MYLAIIVLPLLGSIVSGFFGRKVGVSGAQLITCSCVITTTILAIIAFFEVGLNNIPVSIQLFRWIDSESLNVSWGFHFDSLTVSMLIPVLVVSSLVHIYSISYMSHDPHNQRFFSYLSLFTFMMVILVTANNYLLMFVGWEGNLTKCPKWLSYSDYSVLSFMFIMHTCNHQKRFFFSRSFNSKERIGPHNIDVMSLIWGSLLSNSYLEKRESGLGIRLVFIKYSNNVEYLMWFHSFLAKNGYCSFKKPKLSKLVVKGNKVLFLYSFKSYSFSSFIWLFDIFYRCNTKVIPCRSSGSSDLNEYLTPLAIATLFLSSFELGKNTKLGKKAKLATSLVSEKDLKCLSLALKNKYNIETVVKFNNNAGLYGGSLHIKNSHTFSKIVRPHILHSQYSLLNNPILKLNIFGNIPALCSSSISCLSKRGLSTKRDLSDVRYTMKYKKEYVLSLVQKEALIGIILGDGFLDRPKPNHSTRLRIEQSYPEKEKYLKSLYNLLEPMTAMTPTVLTRKDKRSGNHHYTHVDDYHTLLFVLIICDFTARICAVLLKTVYFL